MSKSGQSNRIKQAEQLVQQGNPSAAAGLLQEELQGNPRSVEALHMLATIYCQHNRLREAIPLMQQAIQIRPTVQTLNNMGVLYMKVGMLVHAEQVLKQALQLDGRHGMARMTYAYTLMGMGKVSEAVEHFRLVRENSPELRTLAIAGGAYAKERCGDTEGAFADIYELIEAGATESNVLRTFCNLVLEHKQFAGHIDRAIGLLESAMQAGSIRAIDLGSYFFLLGQLRQKQQDYDGAFAAFAEAHSHSQKSYNEPRELFIDETIRSVWAGTRPPDPLAATKRNHVFIVGMPRSGSTLVEQVLSVNPDSTDLGECNFFREGVIGVAASGQDPVRVGGRLLTEEEIKKVRSHYTRLAFAERKPTGLVIDKNLFNHVHVGQILQVFPDAKIIWTRRDPRDTCVSCYTIDFAGPYGFIDDLAALARHCNRTESLLRFWCDLYPERIHIVKYEEMIAAPERNIRALTDYCQLPWNDDYLAFHQKKRVVTTASYTQVTRPIYTTARGRWRHYEQHLGPLLEALEIPEDYR